LVVAAAISAPLAAQDLAARVRAVGTGTARVSFPARAGVCGNGTTNVSWNGTDVRLDAAGRRESEVVCETGPVRVALDVERGAVSRVRTYVGGRWRADADAHDLGTVTAPAAQALLLPVVAAGPVKAAQAAIIGVLVADAPTPTDALLRIARATDRPREIRKHVVFWLGQAAGDAITRELGALAEADTVDREIRRQAVFALSRQRTRDASAALVRIARQSRDPELRKTALFWLGQSDDAAAVDLIEEILARRP
jgi:hypothetical protein